ISLASASAASGSTPWKIPLRASVSSIGSVYARQPPSRRLGLQVMSVEERAARDQQRGHSGPHSTAAEERAAKNEQRGHSGPHSTAPEPRGGDTPAPQLAFRVEAGRPWPVHVWRFDRPLRVISCGPYGG